ncbi:pseudouridine synthase [Pavlovales sp. CCMP2436]|nr:pseudouridine synthase [Pavlovales sp. CCMP2436]
MRWTAKGTVMRLAVVLALALGASADFKASTRRAGGVRAPSAVGRSPPRVATAASPFTSKASPFSRKARTLEKQLRSLSLTEDAVAALLSTRAGSLDEIAALSDDALVAAGVPRKSWSTARAGAALLLSEKAEGIEIVALPSAFGPAAVAVRKGPRARAAAFAAANAAEAAMAAEAEKALEKAAAAPASAEEAEAEGAGDVEELAEVTVAAGEEALRLDQLLSARFPAMSRSYFASLCEQGLVTVGGQPAAKASKLRPGTSVSVQFAATEEMTCTPQRMDLDVLWEDDELLVLNKPAGMVVHPAPGNWAGTLVNGVLYRLQQQAAAAAAAGASAPPAELGSGDALTSTVVHRLDKGTTGAITFAKSGEAQRKVSALFAARQVSKHYLAIVVGDPGDAPREITHPIGRDKSNRLKMAVVAEADGGRAARSVVRKLACNGRFSLVSVEIFTGRTHQIRVHLRAEGLPVLGDEAYGSKQWNQLATKTHSVRRPLLHAHKLGFAHPTTGEQLAFEAPLPADLAALAQWIRQTPGATSKTAGGDDE